MKTSEAFPSDYLKASDLNGKSVNVTIADVELVEMGQGQDKEKKLLLTFTGKSKGLICNKTNSSVIESLYSDETNNWIGKAITIAPREVEFQGKMVWAIRVSLKAPAGPTHGVMGKPKQAVAPAPADQDGGGVEEDSVPF